MTPFEVGLSLLIVAAAMAGVRSSWRLARRYWRVAPVLGSWRERLLLGTFTAIAWTITLVALWIGFLTVRRLLGLPAIEGVSWVTGIGAIVILLIPALLDWVVDRIARP